VRSTRASATVFATSAAVLMLEIIAGRLLAPYVGISLETFTGIIGTVLAGIALGAAVGGWLADRHDPATLIGAALVAGGALSWLSLPIVRILGPRLGVGAVAIVVLTSAAFLLPAAVLSAVSPMIAKLRLDRLEETGSVVGGLSAAGTAGALAGTFITGFVLVAAVPTPPIVLGIGAALIVGGVVAHWRLRGKLPTGNQLPVAIAVLATGMFAALTASPCQHETAYYCVRIETDANRPSGRTLYLDRLRNAYVDKNDPTYLDFRYVRLFAAVAAGLPDGHLDALHIGGGGFAFPRYLTAVRPSTTNRVLEIDTDLVGIDKDELGLVEGPDLRVDRGDARLAFGNLPTDGYDLVVGDAFAGEAVPWHLTTAEVMAEIDRVLRPGGIYVMNVIDGNTSGFARAELATLAARFAQVAAILPAGGVPLDRPVNQVLVASSAPLPDLRIDPVDGHLVRGDELKAFIADARPLTDDYAPVDTLSFR
jgi:MFS family permease